MSEFINVNDRNKATRVLVVNSDLEMHNRYAETWAAHDFSTLRVDSVHEGIKRIIHGDVFLFIVINEDTTNNLMHELEFMRDATDLPILIFTSDFNMTKKLEALRLGADMYDPFSKDKEENINDVLLNLKLQERWAHRPQKPLPMIVGGDVILSPSRRAVLINGEKVRFPGKEFDVLQYLMEHKTHYKRSYEILHDVWQDENDIDQQNALYITITRIREKLKKASPGNDYIKMEKNIGYTFSAL